MFFIGLTILSNLQMQIFQWVVFQWKIKSVEQDHKLLMLMQLSQRFFHLVLKQVNVVVVVIILTIYM